MTLLGALGGDQLDQYLAAFKPFEEATGIKVEYEGTRDMLSVLQTRVQGGNPPDVVSNPSLGQMRQLIKDGKLLALNDVVDVEQVKKDYDSGLVELGSQNGTLYGLMQTSALKGMVYYHPEKYQGPTNAADWNALNTWATQQADAGNTPGCLGVENGAASGWMSTDWIEQFVLTTYGTEVWDSWANGELSWNSPEIRAAFEAFGKIATDSKMVNGGPRAVVSTDFIKGSRTASRSRSENVAIPVPSSCPWVACTNRAFPATSPNSQPSPCRVTAGPSTPSPSRVRASRAARTSRITSTLWWPIRSNRNPSTR